MNPVVLALIIIIIGLGVYTWLLRRANLKTVAPEILKDKINLLIAVPIKNEAKALAAEQIFLALHGTLQGRKIGDSHFGFEIYANANSIYFVVTCSPRYKAFIENQIYAQYPDAQIEVVKDYAGIQMVNAQNIVSAELKLAKPWEQSLKTFYNFDVDPLASITSSMTGLPLGTEVWVQLLARPFQKVEKKPAPAAAPVAEGEPKPSARPDPAAKTSNPLFQFKLRILVHSGDKETSKHQLNDVLAAFKQFAAPNGNELVPIKLKSTFGDWIEKQLLGKRAADRLSFQDKYVDRFLDDREPDLASATELASLFHLPNSSVKTPNIAWAKSRKLEYPLNIPQFDPLRGPDIDPATGKIIPRPVRVLGYTDYRGNHLPFGIKTADRRRHMYMLGKTGTGKSTFMRNMIVGDILDGHGLAVLDPHGELVEEILDLIPEYRLKDVIYLDPSDTEFPIGLNMLDIKPDETIDLLADGIVNVFKKFFENTWGPRLQHILANTVLTLLYCQNVSLLAVQRMLSDKNYRKFLLKQVKGDPFIHKFWEEEYAQLAQNPKLLAEAIAPIHNKVGRFLSSPMVRNMIGQIKSTVDLQEVMNDGKILLVNLSQGKIGEENSSLLGAMIVTRLYSNAMQRARLDPKDRKDFFLYVDEFQNFATDTFVKILSEARKYALDLIVTHQYIDQISPEIQDAIFGNVGTLMNYVVGQKDGARLEEEYRPHLTSEDLVNLGKYRLSMKMTIDSTQSPPFTAIAQKPTYQTFGLKEQIKEYNRKMYGKPREVVEQKINKWANQKYDDRGNLMQEGQEDTRPERKPDWKDKKPGQKNDAKSPVLRESASDTQ